MTIATVGEVDAGAYLARKLPQLVVDNDDWTAEQFLNHLRAGADWPKEFVGQADSGDKCDSDKAPTTKQVKNKMQ